MAPLVLVALALLTAKPQDPVVPQPPSAPLRETRSDSTVSRDGVRTRVESVVSTSFTLVPADVQPKTVSALFYCYKTCKGQKHKKHTECDDSCDEACPYAHSQVIYPRIDALAAWVFAKAAPEEYKAFRDVDPQDYDPTPSELAFRAELRQVLEPYRKQARTLVVDHFAKPCSSGWKSFGFKMYTLKAISTQQVTITVGDGLPHETTHQTEFPAATIAIPDQSVVIASGEQVRCLCEDPETWSHHPLVGDDPGAPVWKPTQITWGPPVAANDSGIKWIAQGMGGINSSGTVSNGTRTGIYIGPGSIFEDWDGDDSFQDLVCLTGGNYYFDPADGTLHRANNDGKAEDPILTACTELHKRMPDGRRMKVKPVQDPVLRRIAGLASTSIIRGLYDQQRVWIYTDKATLDEMNKVLIPRASPSSYVRSLYDDFTVGGIDMSKPEFQRLFEPQLLACLTAPPAAKKWFITELAMMDPKGLAKEMQDSGAKIASAVKTDGEITGAAELLDALAGAPAPEVLAALRGFSRALLGSEHGKEIASRSKWLSAAPKS